MNDNNEEQGVITVWYPEYLKSDQLKETLKRSKNFPRKRKKRLRGELPSLIEAALAEEYETDYEVECLTYEENEEQFNTFLKQFDAT